MKLILFHLEGSRKDRTETFEKAKVRAGRDPANDLLFDPYMDRDASGFHAEFEEEDGRVWLKDLGSTNGTFLNGERMQRAALSAGDVVGFGKRGPKVRIETAEAAAGPRPPASPLAPRAGGDGSEDPVDRQSFRKVGTRTMKLIMQDALGKAREKGGMAGGSLFLREMVRQTVKESSSRERRLVFLLAFLLVAAGGVIVYQIAAMERYKKEQQEALDQKDRQMEEQERRWFHKLQETLNRRQEEFESASVEERRRNEEMVESWKEELSLARSQSNQDREKIARLEKLLAGIRSSESLFKKIQKKYDGSIVLLYTEFKVRDASGEEKSVRGFGTGFLVTAEGHVLTNKHVVQPWKFSQMVFRMKERGQERVEEEEPFLAAWLSGKKVYHHKEGKLALQFDTAYTTTAKTLRLEKTAPDKLCWVTRSRPKAGVSKVWAHEPADNNDLALLRILDDGRRFVPLPLMAEPGFRKLEKLDRVMVLGFPRGGSILERGVAETSPSVGHIRKIERSVHISAPITQGNSGGPVFAQNGEVIGISTRMIKDVETYGFCIPVLEARGLLPQEND